MTSSKYLIFQKFERRGRHVQDPEKDMWADVTPAMMSGEEDIGNNTFKVHQPEWRSEELNKLFKDLDARADQAMNKGHARKNRVIGTPSKTAPPSHAKDWMQMSCDINIQSPTY